MAYAGRDGGPDVGDRLGESEKAFIAARDSFFIASASETGWPYVQFRGGPPGFLRVLDDRTLAYPDFRGNRQYITTGNAAGNDRVSLLLIDYPNRLRLKILGRIAFSDIADHPELVLPGYPARPEQAARIAVEGFDWNCPSHITPRFSQDELVEILAPLRDDLTRLKSENERLRTLLKA